MADYIRLTSRVLRAADPWQVDISPYVVHLTVDEKLYERDLLNFLRRFAVTEEAETAAAQDMVQLSCTSENERFCRQHITIRLGMGLFSRELEEALLGWRIGQSGELSAKGSPVQITVEGIRREILPQVDDALAARCGVPGIRTAEDIRRYCRGKQFDDALEEPADEAFAHMSREVMATSEFVLDEEELRICQERMVQSLQKNSLFRDGGMDAMPEETMQEMFGCTKEQLIENMRESGVFMLRAALLGQNMLEREGKLRTMADYEAYVQHYLQEGSQPEEQVRQEKTLLAYMLDSYGDYFMDEMEALALRRLEEATAE